MDRQYQTLIISLWLGLLVGCVRVLSDGAGEAKDGVSKERPPDIFLFTVDTLRADHLPIYGYARDTAPWLTSLAEHGMVFDNGYGTSSWTVPSVASLLTGMQPWQLGVSNAPNLPKAEALRRPRIPEAAVSIAEWLGGVGYETFGITSNAHLTQVQGFGQGFDVFRSLGFVNAYAVGRELERSLDLISASESPVFVWIHLFDPHDPYVRHDPWMKEWDPDFTSFSSELPNGKAIPGEAIVSLRKRRVFQRNGAGLPHLRSLYDAEIRYADETLSQMMQALDVGTGDIVIFAADHGDEFRDHGSLGHRVNLYQETVRVPIVLAGPGIETGRNSRPVSLVQLPRTIAELVGSGSGSAPPAEWVGPSLLSGSPGGESSPLTLELVRSDGLKMWSVIEGSWKLILDPATEGGKLLFDLEEDPGELHNLASSQTERCDRMQERLEQHLASLSVLEPAFTDDPLDPEVQEQLRAMGYLE